MNIIQEYYYKKGQLEIIENLRSDKFTPCRQSNKLKHYLNSQFISLEADIEELETKINEHLDNQM